jgi:hypothetical protein
MGMIVHHHIRMHPPRPGRWPVISAMVTAPGARRVAVQERVATEVLCQLVTYLREIRR